MPSRAADFKNWEIPGIATFQDRRGGLVRIVITTSLASAEVYLQGAHITHFQPTGAEPVLFLSERTHLSPGKAIRGGVPVIFPWFGARANHPESPAHGFARTMEWELESLTCADGATVELVLRLASSETTRALWPHDFILRHRITIGAQLHMALEIENRSDAPFIFEEALHTYLAVGDVRQVSIGGLESAEYLDKVDGARRKREGSGRIRITGETDRVYLNTITSCVLHDISLARRIVVEKSGSATTVVWNPWISKAKAMSDFGDDEWPAMLCIETTNAADNAVALAAKSHHVMSATVRLAQ